MAVYTDVSAEDLADFLADYDLGELLSYKGIAEGVENSNFLVHTSQGYFILTLYEKRVAPEDLPFFLGLMEHLAARGLICPQPVKNRTGDMLGMVAGRPAAIVTVPRRHVVRRPSAAHCTAVGEGAREDASCRARTSRCAGATRCRSTAGARSTWHPRPAPTSVQPGLRETIEPSELTMLERRLAVRPAGGRDPCRPVPRQRVLPRRHGCPA